MVGDPARRGPLRPSRVETRVGERQSEMTLMLDQHMSHRKRPKGC
jgi:hypothetical protein